MNKTNMILICIIIALISGIIGFIIGINFKGNNEINSSSVSMKNEEKNLVGTYRTNTWNGKEAVIALKSDKTMICPNGSGTWSFEMANFILNMILKFHKLQKMDVKNIKNHITNKKLQLSKVV